MRVRFLSCLSISLACSTPSAAGWDGIKSGKIIGIDVADGENFGFRIYMDGAPMCGTSETWGYLNKSWDNYDAAVALLTSAFYAGKSVTLFTVKKAPYCEIRYVMLR